MVGVRSGGTDIRGIIQSLIEIGGLGRISVEEGLSLTLLIFIVLLVSVTALGAIIKFCRDRRGEEEKDKPGPSKPTKRKHLPKLKFGSGTGGSGDSPEDDDDDPTLKKPKFAKSHKEKGEGRPQSGSDESVDSTGRQGDVRDSQTEPVGDTPD